MNPRPCIVDSITAVPADARGHAVVCASHGGRYAAYCAKNAGVSAVVFNDAGIGRERAGVAGLEWLAQWLIPAAAVSCVSARIGDGHDTFERGVVSTVNDPALALGVRPGMRASEVAERFCAAEARGNPGSDAGSFTAEARSAVEGFGDVPVLSLDSASLVTASDRDAIVITASHGGLVGGDPHYAIKADVFAAFFNDATIGIDNAGIGRLAPLDARGIAAVTVSAWSARIGDGRSTLDDGFISAANARAQSLGAEVGLAARAWVERLAEQWPRRTSRSQGPTA